MDKLYNTVQIGLQIAVRYGSTVVYSNYDQQFDDRLGFRMWEPGVLDEEGTKDYGSFERPGNEAEGQHWRVDYDFVGAAYDAEDPGPVPIPGGFLLLGSGLVGLVLRRRAAR